MGEFADKAKGKVNELTGKAKQAIGRDQNDPDLEAEGAGQEGRGHLQQAKGKVKGMVKHAVDKA
ncbi:MAG TPA: CsbD family protein [Sphingomonas sp.]|nr:CsbD family protein [Sphingomonas sp.]